MRDQYPKVINIQKIATRTNEIEVGKYSQSSLLSMINLQQLREIPLNFSFTRSYI